MTLPTEAERKEWWIRAYAYTSFEKSLNTCKLLLKLVDTTDHPLYFPLATALHVFYARPFMCNYGAGSLPKDYIPNEWRGIHDCMMKFRCSVFAHTEATLLAQIGRPLNDVVYSKHGEEVGFSTSDPSPRLEHYRNIDRYLPLLLAKVKDEINGFEKRFIQLLPASDGDYFLSLAPSTELFFIFNPPNSDTITFGPKLLNQV